MVLPLPPNRANARGRWETRYFGQLRYHTMLDDRQRVGLVPPPPTQAYAKVAVTVAMYVWGRMDQGNAVNRMKWIEDWLVSRGYVIDDTEECFRYTGFPTQKVDRKNQRVEIELEEIT